MAITDLTGYSWVGNASSDGLLPGTYNSGFRVSGIATDINGEEKSFDFIRKTLETPPDVPTITQLDFCYGDGDPELKSRILFNTRTPGPSYLGTGGYASAMYNSNWQKYVDSPASDVIHFTGGADATNSLLIAWLEENGTLTREYYATLSGLFTDIANAIRERSGKTNQIAASTFPNEILALGAKAEIGTFTVSSTQTTITFNHALGKTPNIIYVDNGLTSTNYTNRAIFCNSIGRVCRGTTSAPTTATFTISDTSISIPRSGSYHWAAGTYKYIIGYIE